MIETAKKDWFTWDYNLKGQTMIEKMETINFNIVVQLIVNAGDAVDSSAAFMQGTSLHIIQ
ncbi:hypothetical protein NDK25_20840 [Niallia taxi]|nr:hypothetical protein [Niallia taxi]MDE5054664.1 hypothetical protein [Niallia taxi]